MSRSFNEELGPIACIAVWRVGDFFGLEDLGKLAIDAFNEELRKASWLFAVKETLNDVSHSVDNCVHLISTLYEEKKGDSLEAFRATSLAFLISGIHIFAKSKAFKDLLLETPEFASDWAVAVMNSMASVKMPHISTNKCAKCKRLSQTHLNRVKWIQEQVAEHLCRHCFPLECLEESDEEASQSTSGSSES